MAHASHRRNWALLAACIGAGVAASAAAHAAALPTGIDFSFAGYGGAGVALPAPAATLLVEPTGQDDTRMLQAAIDKVAAMATGPDGIRGVILLGPGKFLVKGQVSIGTGGVVLRGSGAQATTLLATGVDRRTIIDIRPMQRPTLAPSVNVTADAPAGATVLTLADVAGLVAGDRMVITRPCTDAWIKDLKMDTYGPDVGQYPTQRITWLPGSREVVWDRQIVAVDPARKQITLDVPITTALETRYGLGTAAKITAHPPITQVGVEALTLESEVAANKPKDENHSWIALAMDNVEDAWVRDVTARHFAASGVRIGPRGRRITVENCRVESPVSEIGGWRRANFRVEGQQVLVRDCYSEAGVDDFAVGLCAGGPDVFLDCQTKGSVGASGSIESWASGMLYERVKVDGADLRLTYDMERTQGGGWTAANSVIWNCQANAIEAKAPEGAANVISDSKEPLYETMLKARGKALPAEGNTPTDASKAAAFQWQEPKAGPPAPVPELKIVNGRFVVGDHALWGGQLTDALWQGQATSTGSARIGSQQITRYIPGREGPGFTENLPELSQRMVSQGVAFYYAFPGLWYDRRRDAHNILPRPDGNVWAPFLELPWGRSGEGTGYDGLSKYDVSTYNPWYYQRLKEFAELSAKNGTVLFHSLYDTHNVLEIIPHYEDFPWRPVNNINNDGMPEPPLMDKPTGTRFHMGNQFYDPTNYVLRELHRKFILHELDELADQPNLIFSTAYQFVGPLSFQQFFQDTIAEWEKAHSKKVKVLLMTTKDITDAILEDRVRSQQVVAVDMHYWQYRPEGDLWAPAGGRNRAFRAMTTESWPGYQDSPPPTTPEQAYRQVREYKDKYPDLAIISPGNDAGPLVPLIAGAAESFGNTRPVDAWINKELGNLLMTMSPQDRVVTGIGGPTWCLGDQKLRHILFYSLYGASMELYIDLPAAGYTATWVNPQTGETQPMTFSAGRGRGAAAPPAAAARGGPVPSPWIKTAVITKPDANAWLLYLKANGEQ